MADYLGTAVLEVGANLAPLRAGLLEAERMSAASLAKMQREQSTRMGAFSASMGTIGSRMTRSLTVPILGVAGAATKMSINFDRAMEMIHTQAGASQKEVDKLKGKVLDLGKTVPYGPTQLADAMFHIESIGARLDKRMLSVGESVGKTGNHARKTGDAMGMLKAAAEGAAVGHAKLEDTATALGSAWLVGIKGAGNFHHTMGILNATVGAGNMRMDELVKALGTGLLPMAKLAGLSITDAMGALAVFTDEGYNASSAATQMATALHYLYAPTDKATKALKGIGMTHDQLAADMRKPNGLATALRDLQGHLDSAFPTKKLTKSERAAEIDKVKASLEQAGVHGKALNDQLDIYSKKLQTKGYGAVQQEQVLGDIFPAGRGRVMTVLMNQLDRYAGPNGKLKQIGHTQKQFGEDVKKTMEQPAVRVQQAWATLQASLVKFGEQVGPPLIDMGTKVLGLVTKTVDKFNSLDPGLKHAIVTGGLVLAGIGPAMRVLGLFTSGVDKLWRLGGRLNNFTKAGVGKAAAGEMTVAAMTVDTMEVANMEVANMIVHGYAGGGGAPGVGPAGPGPGPGPVGRTGPGAATRGSRLALAEEQALLGAPVGRVGAVVRTSEAEAQAEARALLERYGRLRGSARVMATQGGYTYEDASLGGPYDRIRGGRRVRIVPRYGEPGTATEDPAMRYLRQVESRNPEVLSGRYAAYQRELESGVLGTGARGRLSTSRAILRQRGVLRNPFRGLGASAASRLTEGGLRGVGGRLIGGAGTAGMIFMGGQAVSAITGSKAVGHIGNLAAGGAMAGSVFGPEGMIVGALGGALVGGITQLFKSKSLEEKVADSLGKSGMFQGGPLTDAQKQAAQTADARRKQAAHDVTRATQLAEQGDLGTWNARQWQDAHPRRPGETSDQYGARMDAARLRTTGQTRRSSGQQRVFENLAGIRLGQSLDTELGTYKHIDAGAITDQFTRVFDNPKLNDQMRAAGANHIIAWAKGMEKEGRLPKGAAQQIFTNITNDFPGIQRKFRLLGINSMAGLSDALHTDSAGKATRSTISDIASQWAGMPRLLKNTASNMTTNVATELDYLHSQVQTTTGKTHDDALKNFNQLRHDALHSFKTLRDQTNQSFSDMSAAIKDNSGTARHDAVHNFNQLFSQVGAAVDNGVITTSHGAALIFDSLNSLLVAFGGTPIPKGALNRAQQSSLAGAIASHAIDPATAPSGGALAAPDNRPAGHARGGAVQFGIPGQKGRDDIPVNFGGVPVVVGAGEMGAVFTGEQQAVANAFLSPIGGLDGLFSQHSTPHWAGFQQGGVVSFKGLKNAWVHAGGPANMAQIMAAIAEAESHGQLNAQGPPTKWGRARGAWQILGQIVPGNIEALAINAKNAVAKFKSQGLTAWETYTNGAYRHFLNGVAGGSDFATGDMRVRSPKIDGKGTMPSIERLAMHMATKAANHYLNKHTQSTPGSGTSAGPTSGPNGTEMFDGLPVAKWIVPVINWVRHHGWHGKVTSGWRSPSEVVHGVFATAPQGQSEHKGTQYPHGAIDVSNWDQFAAVSAGYPGARRLIQLGIDPMHFSGTGHARGGWIYMQNGGPLARTAAYPHTPRRTHFPTSRSSGAGARARVTSTHKAKAKAIKKPPRLRSPKDFASGDFDKITALDSAVNELSAWQSFIQGLHGNVPASTTYSDEHGVDVLNWGAPGPPPATVDWGISPTTLTGHPDQSGMPTKSIWDRVREIGRTTDTVRIGDTQATELGLAEQILAQEIREQNLAYHLKPQFLNWYASESASLQNDSRADAFITKGLDSTTPYDALPHAPFDLGAKVVFHGKKRVSRNYAKMIRDRVRDYKRTLARIIRTRLRAGFLPEERRHAHEAITKRYLILRRKLAKQRQVTKGSLLAEQHAALTIAERETLRGVPSTAPHGWQGDRQSWSDQAKDERTVILNDFTLRRAALQETNTKQRIKATMTGSEAVSALGLRELSERSKVGDIYDGKERHSRSLVQSLSQRRDTDRNYLREWLRSIKGRERDEKSSISTADAADGMRSQLDAYLDPAGTLGINIATKQKIDIPALIRESAGLAGTTLTGQGAGGADSQLAGLLQQQLAMVGQQLAISQAQYKVLANLDMHTGAPPFGGHFAEGGIVPGPTGAARTIVAHGGERVLTPEQQGGGITVIVQDGAVDPDKIRVIANGEVQKVTRQAARMGGRRLPSAGGGL